MRRSYKYLSPDCMISAVKISRFDIPEFAPAYITGPRDDAETIEDVKDFDRMWFAMHPGERKFYRMITRPEIGEWWRQNPGEHISDKTIICVEQIMPGMRRRSSYMKLLDE